MSETVILEKDAGTARILLNRPETYNSFDLEMIDRFAGIMISLTMDESVRVIVIAGQGKAFCAGGDLKWALGFPAGPAAGFHELAACFHQAIREIRRTPKPVIAAVNGAAAGGGFSLALACDFRVMAESALLRQAFTSNGLSIDGGGTFSLPRLVGLARAIEIAAFDRPIPAAQALEWGLATKVVPDGKALDEALALAGELQPRALQSFGLCKKLLTDSFDTSFETHIERERLALAASAAGPDGREGLRAFVEKRRPNFRG
ncbi:MAG: enoyl-CoA hydratase-related protein [Thermodesulfobacteriota bacterium]